jgi:hypothetical protein
VGEFFDSVGKNAQGEDIDATGDTSMLIGGKDVITVRALNDREIDAQIRRKNSDGTDWKIIYDTPNNPSTYFLAARAHSYFAMSTQAVIVPLHQLEAWLRGVIPMPPKPRDDHLFDNKAAAFAWLHTLTPSIEAEFARDRKLFLPSHARSTGTGGMQSISEVKKRANPFR